MENNMDDFLLPVVEEHEEIDHPEGVTAEEEALGLAAYLEVDDTDDEDSGILTLRSFARSGYDIALSRARVMKEILLRHGVPEVSIELLPGRPTSGDVWNAIRPVGSMAHHIASRPTVTNPVPGLWLVKNGRSDLDGPLANGTAGVDLVYRIICMGLANHPGTGGPITLRGPMGNYTIPKDNARAYTWGTEYEGGYDDATWDRVYQNKRTGKKMTFREFMGRCNAGLTEAIWAINGMGKMPRKTDDLSGYQMEHKTWAPGRKPDRMGYTTESGRAEVRKYDDRKKLPIVDLSNMINAARGRIKKPLPGVRRVQRALNVRLGTTLKSDGIWGKETTNAYRKWQKHLGYSGKDADGIPGRQSLTKLGADRYRVKS